MGKVLYRIAGANGSGKTTLAHELLREEKDLVFLNADEIAAKINDKIGLRSGRVLLEKLQKLFAERKSIVLESTISGNYHEKVIEQARKLKYKIILVYVFLDDVRLNLLRIEQRVATGGHNVPRADVVRRC